VQASYASGSTTTALVFTYTILAGQTDTDGISIDANRLTLNSGTLKDGSGNDATLTHSAVSDNASYMVDTTAPSAPSAPDMTAGTDTGSSSTDNITSNTTPTFTGTAESGSTVKLYDTDGTTLLGTGTATGGNYSIAVSTLTSGAHTITAKATDTAGNVSSASTGLGVTIDTTAPTESGSTSSALAQTTATVSSTSNEAGTMYYVVTTSNTPPSAAQVIAGQNNASGAAVSSGNSAVTASSQHDFSATGLTATTQYYAYFVTVDAAGNQSSVASSSFTTAANGPTVSDSHISITSTATGSGGVYKIGDTVTATWNNTAAGDNQSGITGVTSDFSQFGGGAAVAATNDGNGNWTASYTIVSGTIDATNKNVSVTATDVNGSTTTADTTNLTVDNQAPTVTDAKISISGASGTGGAYKIGDTVTATWNNTAAGDNNTDTMSGVSFNFSAFGGGAAVAASNSSGTWTATYTITSGAIDGINKNVSATVTDNAGNTTTTADTTNATVDTQAPTVTDGNISISGATGTGGAYKIGDTVTVTWNNTAGGDNNSDTLAGVTVDFSQFGGGAAVAATNSSGTWTATYTIVAGAISTTNRNVSVTVTDNAGNSTTTADSSNATVDNIAPTTTIATTAFSADTGTSSTDFITKTAAQTVSGTLSANLATG
jgi:hypothetical protein